MQRTHFIPKDAAGSRQDTAVLLVGTAREYGIAQRSILSQPLGYAITQDLYDLVAPVLYPETTTRKRTKKTSGNRAAKSQPTEKE